MNHALLRSCALLLFGTGLFSVAPAYAAITCSNVSISNLTFGNVDPQSSQTDVSATLRYSCRNSGLILTPKRSATPLFQRWRTRRWSHQSPSDAGWGQ